jgi:putative flippase GtrA
MLRDVSEVLHLAFRFRLRELSKHQLVRVGAIGALGALVQFSFFEIFGIQTNIFSPRIAAVLGGELGVITVFLIHHFFTFRNVRDRAVHGALKFIYFNITALVSLVMQYALVWIGERVSGGNEWVLRAFNLLGILIGFIFNYVNYTRVIWKTREGNREL